MQLLPGTNLRPDARRGTPLSRVCADSHGLGRTLFSSNLIEIRDARCNGETGRTWSGEAVAASHEVQVVRRGAYARSLRGEVTLVHSGVTVFTNPGDEVRIAHPVSGGEACSIFRLPAEGVRALVTSGDREHEGALPRFPRSEDRLAGSSFLLHQLAMQAARRAAGDAFLTLVAEERALAFLRSVTASAVTPPRGGQSRAREARNRHAREYVMRVRTIIAQHYQEPLTIGYVAARAGCSPYHLSRVVTAYEGVPIYQLIIRYRLRQSLERVLGTRDSLSSIALDTGFASQSHFGDAFRREFGCPPGAARRAGGIARRSSRLDRTRLGAQPHNSLESS